MFIPSWAARLTGSLRVAIRRVFSGSNKNRVAFLVDGFNLYHSIIDASYDLGGVSTKWLNLHSFCSSYLSQIGDGAQLQRVHYFSALAYHLEHSFPGKVDRHQRYISCLRSTGVIDELARFKKKRLKCGVCHQKYWGHEEKETDVAIATKLFEVFYLDECDSVVLVTGDTDLCPAIEAVTRHFPTKRVFCLFPYKRKNKDLTKLVTKAIKVKAKQYTQHQLPNPVVLANGTEVYKPSTW